MLFSCTDPVQQNISAVTTASSFLPGAHQAELRDKRSRFALTRTQDVARAEDLSPGAK